ncbi:MAG TPA: O-antigen ligase family protein [Geminicoccaceae bacterium]
MIGPAAAVLTVRADLVQRLGAILLIAMPVLLVVGQAAADIALSLIAVLFVLHSARTRDFAWLEEPWVLVGLTVWIWLMLGAWYVAADTTAANSRAAPFGRFVVFAAALQFWLFDDPVVRRTFLRVLGLVLAFVVLDCLVQYLSGEDLLGRPAGRIRLTGPFDETVPGGFLSRLALPLVAFGFGWAATIRGSGPTIGVVAATALVGLAIALTGERAALIMFAFGLGLLFLLLPEARRPLLVTGLIGALLVGGAVLTQPNLKTRLVGHTARDLTDFWDRRVGELLLRGLEVWQAHPVTGIGLKNFRQHCERDDFEPRGRVEERCYTHPHHIWNEWLAETGLIGFAGFLALLGLWGRAIVRGLQRLGTDYPLALGTGIALLIFLWPLRPSMSFFSNWLAAMFWLMLGLALALTAPRGGRPNPPS